MKRLLLLLTTSAMLAFILSGALAETKIMVVSDIHFLSHSLYEDESPSFAEVVSKGAGKATQYSSELLDGLLAEARHQRPDILLLAGDLSFNGEAASHLELAEAMRELKAEGIPVAVIPGNHDINSENAVRFTDAGIERVDAVDSAAFGRIWQGDDRRSAARPRLQRCCEGERPRLARAGGLQRLRGAHRGPRRRRRSP